MSTDAFGGGFQSFEVVLHAAPLPSDEIQNILPLILQILFQERNVQLIIALDSIVKRSQRHPRSSEVALH